MELHMKSRWLSLVGGTTRKSSRRSARAGRGGIIVERRKPRLEALEDRSLPSVTLLHNYSALDFNQSGGYVPPDTCGAAGPTEYVETVNSTVAIFSSKTSGGSPLTDDLNHFFFTTGGLTHVDSGASLSDAT